MVTTNGQSSWIVQGTNGLALVWEDTNLTVYFAADHTLTIDVDRQTRKPMKMTLETPPDTREPGYWIVDRNADGVPDTRRIKGKSETEVFYLGEWCPSDQPTGGARMITSHGQKVRVVFDGNRWHEAP
ncbi:MAG TPA: hypothetical protein VK615_07185 [Candidatus Binatia bacterium]|nr:hypothetical protein [Candidatus Binatia bacterium]